MRRAQFLLVLTLSARFLSWCIPITFIAFVGYANHLGISKDSIYVGPVGASLGLFLAFSLFAILSTLLLILIKLLFDNQVRRDVRRLVASVLATVVMYAGWSWYLSNILHLE